MRDTPPYPIEPVKRADLLAELAGLLRECLPWVKKMRFGNHAAAILTERIEAAIFAAESDAKG